MNVIENMWMRVWELCNEKETIGFFEICGAQCECISSFHRFNLVNFRAHCSIHYHTKSIVWFCYFLIVCLQLNTSSNLPCFVTRLFYFFCCWHACVACYVFVFFFSTRVVVVVVAQLLLFPYLLSFFSPVHLAWVRLDAAFLECVLSEYSTCKCVISTADISTSWHNLKNLSAMALILDMCVRIRTSSDGAHHASVSLLPPTGPEHQIDWILIDSDIDTMCGKVVSIPILLFRRNWSRVHGCVWKWRRWLALNLCFVEMISKPFQVKCHSKFVSDGKKSGFFKCKFETNWQ